MNQAPHSLDQFIWLGGQPKSVQAIATTRLHEIEVENTASAIMDYGTGQIGQFYVSTAEIPLVETMEIVGENGALIWNGTTLRRLTPESPINEHLKTSSAMSGNEGTWSEIELEDAPEGVGEVHRAFARAIRENDPTLMVASGEDGLRSLELANAILLAGYTRREVKLPLARDAFERTLKKLQNGIKPQELYRG